MRTLVAGLLACLGVATLGCASEPLYEVDRAIIPEEPSWTLEDMTRAIQRAGVRRGWDMRILEPGQIEGRLRKPFLSATVSIDYTPSEFSIRYKDSENMAYVAGRIHGSYNRWVYNLERDVRREFLRMRPSEIHIPAHACFVGPEPPPEVE